MRKALSTLMIVALAVGGLSMLVYATGLRDRSAIAFGSPSGVSVVRAHYAAVNHYIATGEMDAVNEIAASTTLDPGNRSGPGCADASHLSALRRTYPQMHVTIDNLLRDGSTVIAEVSVDAGEATSFGAVALMPLGHWRMTERFSVVDGRVVDCDTFGPGQALIATMNRVTEARLTQGSLVIARISFERDSQDYLPIPAPAIISVERGVLMTPGNGVSVLTRAHGQQMETTEPGRAYRLEPGDVLVVSAGRAVLSNAGDQSASVLVATMAPDLIDAREAQASSSEHRLMERIVSPTGGKIEWGISAQPLVRSPAPIRAAHMELMSSSIVVTPGGSATIEGAATNLLLVPLIGNPIIERNGSTVTIRNPTDYQVLVQVAVIDKPKRH